MAVWGPGAFDNDDAQAFAAEVAQDGPPALEEAFAVVNDEEGYLEQPEAARAIAAAEVLAAHLTGDAGPLPAALRGWPGTLAPAALAHLRDAALDALDRVDSEESELADLWDEGGEAESWRAELARLKQVLGERREG